MYSQMMYCLERVRVLAALKPALKNAEPFKTVLSGNQDAIAKLTQQDLEKIIVATLSGMTTDEFNAEVKKCSPLQKTCAGNGRTPNSPTNPCWR
jgi:hypothetical protein